MLRMLRRIFRNNSTAEKRPQDRHAGAAGDLTPALNGADPVRDYYDTMSKMQGAISRRDYDIAAGFVRE